ncbi:MAG: DUF1573 domain-containing protein [Phycisphaerales bacterium]
MTRMLLAMIAAVVAAGSAQALPPAASPPSIKPKGRAIIKFENDVFKFGDISDDEDVETSFKFTNAGDVDLVIDKLEADCGCTVPELDKWVYAPGESGEIHVKYDTYPGLYADGERKITVLSNDYRGGKNIVKLAGRVRPLVWARPGQVFLGNVPKGETNTATIEVSGRTDDFQVTGASVEDTDHFSVKILETRPTRGRFGETLRGTTIEVTFNGYPQVAQFEDTLKVQTNDSRRPEVEIPLSVAVQGDIEVRPPMVRIKPREAGEKGEGAFMLRHRKGETFEIVSVEAKTGTMEIETHVEPLEEKYGVGYIVKLECVAPLGTEPGDGEAEVNIVTDVAGEGTINVPVRMRILRTVDALTGAKLGADAKGKNDG